jgi:hypothetical protein
MDDLELMSRLKKVAKASRTVVSCATLYEEYQGIPPSCLNCSSDIDSCRCCMYKLREALKELDAN